MPARLAVHDPEGAALEFWLEQDGSFVFGRGGDADICVRHASVSRHHLRIELDDGRCRVEDLGSKNGLIVDGQSRSSVDVDARTWLQAGDLLLEIEPCSAELLQFGRARRQQRTQRSQTLRVAAPVDTQGFLGECLGAVAELAECDHAALVLPDGPDFRIVEARDTQATVMNAATFRGSHAALRRALASRQPVVVNDIQADAQLAGRQSVLQAGIRSLMVLPLLHDEAVSGLLYADRRRQGQPITEFDLELVAAFTERMSLWMAACRCLASLDGFPQLADAGVHAGNTAAA